MRYTSDRRRAVKRGKAYLGTPGKALVDRGTGPLALPPDTPAAVQCPDCRVWVRALTNGRPAAHARGGWRPNVRAGRPACPNSGGLT